MTPLTLSPTLPHPHTYLHSHFVFSQSLYLYQFLHHADCIAYVTYAFWARTRVNSRPPETPMRKCRDRVFDKKIGKRTALTSHSRDTAISLYISFSLSLFHGLFYRYSFEIRSFSLVKSRVARPSDASSRGSLSFAGAATFFTRLSLSLVFYIITKRTCL